MNGCGSGRGVWIVGLLVLGGLAPSTTEAQPWHELYTDGLAALRNGQGQRAVELLNRAVEERPRPGLLVPTYGTNFVPQYFPYLRLAEAYLLLDAAEDADEALRVSARLGIESVEERAVLEARVRAAIDAKGPASDPTPASEPTPATDTRATPEPPSATEAVVAPPQPEPDDTEPTPPTVAPAREETPTPPPVAPSVESGRRSAETPALLVVPVKQTVTYRASVEPA